MVAEVELQHYQVKVGYLGFMNQYFICVQLTSLAFISAWIRAFMGGILHDCSGL